MDERERRQAIIIKRYRIMSRRKKKSQGLYDEFISEYNRLKLTKLEPYVLADIIVQANRRRKREVAKWKHEATAYRRQFIRERDAHVRTQNNFRKHLDECERREQDGSHLPEEWSDLKEKED